MHRRAEGIDIPYSAATEYVVAGERRRDRRASRRSSRAGLRSRRRRGTTRATASRRGADRRARPPRASATRARAPGEERRAAERVRREGPPRRHARIARRRTRPRGATAEAVVGASVAVVVGAVTGLGRRRDRATTRAPRPELSGAYAGLVAVAARADAAVSGRRERAPLHRAGDARTPLVDARVAVVVEAVVADLRGDTPLGPRGACAACVAGGRVARGRHVVAAAHVVARVGARGDIRRGAVDGDRAIDGRARRSRPSRRRSRAHRRATTRRRRACTSAAACPHHTRRGAHPRRASRVVAWTHSPLSPRPARREARRATFVIALERRVFMASSRRARARCRGRAPQPAGRETSASGPWGGRHRRDDPPVVRARAAGHGPS